MNDPGRFADPFGATTSAAEYVARAASEAVLEGAEWALRAGRRTLVLTGPAGIGKTIVMRVLERRLGDAFRVVYAPYAALPADELCAWVLGLLDEKSQGEPEQELVAYARRCSERNQGLLVMIDDAGHVPVATARRLAALSAQAEGTLRLLLVCADEEPAERILPALGPVVEELRLEAPMTHEETIHYVEQRLARARTPDAVRMRFDPDTVAAIHRRSRGLPGVVHQIASEIVRGRETEAVVGPITREPFVPDPLWGADEIDENFDISVPRELRRRGRGRTVLQSAPRIQLLMGAALLLTLAAMVLPWLRPSPTAPAFDRDPVREIAPAPEPEPRLAPREPRVAPEPIPVAERLPEPSPLPAEGVPELAEDPLPEPVLTPVESGAVAPGIGAQTRLPVSPALEFEGEASIDRRAAPDALEDLIEVNINATPWALIAVDGITLGETPLANVRLVEGEHELTATFPDGRVEVRQVQVDAENRHFGFGPGFGAAPAPAPAP